MSLNQTYRLKVSYDGSLYHGWQIQRGSSEKTIQGELNKALIQISKSEDIKSVGSGRTDAGVHALGQTVKVEMPLNIEPISLQKALSSHLPRDIRILHVEKCPIDFCPIRDAKSKEYRYLFTNQPFLSPFQIRYSTNISSPLDFSKMKQACKILQGELDFQNYFCVGTPVKTTRRSIFKCELRKNDCFWDPRFTSETYFFCIEGSGFLKQMVRLLMGTLWDVGKGRVGLDQFQRSFHEKLEGKLSAVAPPQGLFLWDVFY